MDRAASMTIYGLSLVVTQLENFDQLFVLRSIFLHT